MVDVCVDSSFSRDESGVLSVRRCGNGASASWPFPSDPAITNGLKKDDVCGLWVAPEKQILRIGFSHSQSPGSVMNVATINGATLVANITNPSATLTMLLVMGFHVEWRVGQEVNAFSAVRFGWSRDNGTVATREVGSNHRPAGTTSANPAGWIETYHETVTDILTPGQSATYRILPAVSGFTTGVDTTYIGSTERIDGFGITL